MTAGAPHTRTLRVADLACGAGLAMRGFIDGCAAYGVRVEVAFACDPWVVALDVYRASIPECDNAHCMTAEQAVAGKHIPPVDLVMGGPPCIRDSVMACARKDIPNRDAEMAAVKSAVLEAGRSAPMLAIETVRGWDAWGVAHGLTPVVFDDAALGGFTIRRRTFLLRGVDTSELPWRPGSPGWGKALPEWARHRLTSDVYAVAKRRHASRPSYRPATSVVGHGAAHLVYNGAGAQVYRCTPEDELRLQGFTLNDIRLDPATPVRDRQTMVGNGWPRSYGKHLARRVVATLRLGEYR